MAALTITAASVIASPSARISSGTAGAAITAGQPIYLDSTTKTLKLSLAAGTAAQSAITGIALNSASAGQPLDYVVSDADLAIGGTVEAGEVYAVGAVAGSIVPVADLVTGNFTTIVGVATSASKIKVNASAFNSAGVAKV